MLFALCVCASSRPVESKARPMVAFGSGLGKLMIALPSWVAAPDPMLTVYSSFELVTT